MRTVKLAVFDTTESGETWFAALRKTWFIVLMVILSTSLAQAQTPDEWRTSIDELWGDGLLTEEKLAIFDRYWAAVDSGYAAFPNLDVDWHALRAKYRPEVEAGVSRGRFAGIMNHLALALREPHTFALDSLVNVQTPVEPGVPLLYAGPPDDHGHFGACLTPLPDSTLLVYDAVDNHPLGLKPGDVMIGYDGVAWKTLYRDLLRSELPLVMSSPDRSGSRWGASPSAFEHKMLESAGMNWHLFEQIDVLRYGDTSVESLSLAPLDDAAASITCAEQLHVPGVSIPTATEPIRAGIVEGTRTGYVYVRTWLVSDPDSDLSGQRLSKRFASIVDSLIREADVEALIFDYRTNDGGLVPSANDGYALLFDGVRPTLHVAVRNDPADWYSFEFCPRCITGPLEIPDDDSSFDGPIAILSGPSAFSAGDYNIVRLQYHPNTRTFGKPSSASFSAANPVPLFADGWRATVSFFNTARLEDPDRLLTHQELPVDEAVWLEQDDVVRGEDTVVKAALDWTSRVVASSEPRVPPGKTVQVVVFPNPASASATISVSVPESGHGMIDVFDVTGRMVLHVLDSYLPAGPHQFELILDGLAEGTYFWRFVHGKVLSSGAIAVVR